MLKKIAIIGTVGLPANYGGFETLTEYLTKYLAHKYDITVYCSSKSYNNKLKQYNNARLKYIPLQANGVQSILYDIVSLFSALRFADTILVLGVSGCIVLPFIKLISSKIIIVNIDGQEWKRVKWGKAAKWFLKYSEKLAVKYADSIVSDNKVIKDYVKKTYDVNCELIAYGGDHAKKEILTPKVITNYPFISKKYAFKVCRIEPENNIEMILEAFSEYPNLEIVIVGNWENSFYGKKIKLKFDRFENIHLLNPIHNQKKLNQIRSNCYIYVHGHSAGGTNPSLVEAMYLELPIISFRISYNIATTKNKALYFKNKLQLINILNSIQDVQLRKISTEMKTIANRKYTWSSIANQYAELIR